MNESININGGHHQPGLSAAEVLQSRNLHGRNVLTPPRRKSMWRLYAEKYNDPIIRILLVAAAVSVGLAFVSGDFVETIGIILAVFFATTVGFYFERDAARRFDVLTALGEEQPVKVVRDGHVQQVGRRDVVVGDLVIVETGDEVPADGTLVEATDLQIDESSLTGEPMATKQVVAGGARNDGAHLAAYPEDMVLRSSMVMGGRGLFCVTAVGDETEIGHVARQATELTGVKTPLSLQLDRLARLISKAGTAVAVAAFGGFLLHDVLTQPLWHTTDYVAMAGVVLRYFMMAVTLIVMAVPEGLPMAVTLALALNMRRMLKTNNLVRHLQASETMGAVTVVCTDKTGTLTENRMAVAAAMTRPDVPAALWHAAIAVNTTAELDGDRGIGNPTEVALLRYLQAEGIDYKMLRRQATVTSRVPFSTERKYMETTAVIDGTSHRFVKGAPEVVHPSPSTHHPSPSTLHEMQAQLQAWQEQAMRTLAIACDGEWIGIVGIADPIRADVAQAVGDCRAAGVEVKMVTGDNELTAVAIARQAGLSPLTAISGSDFAALSDAEASERAKTLKVMYRARPADKQRLVQLLQEQGEVVAVTGDGTNDAPALNHAHVGLSLGSGTSVAKEASDITLIDDSFRSLVRAIEWGRSLYRNIQRFIYFQLTVNVTALLLVLGGAVIGTEMPLTVTQILWVNLIMDTFAAMALASLPPSTEVMGERPRRSTDAIISRSMWRGIAVTGGLFFLLTFAYLYWLEHNGDAAGIDLRELTKFFTVFVMLQWWNLFNARAMGSRRSAFCQIGRSRGFLLVLVMTAVGQWAIVQWGGKMFRTVPLSAVEWLQIVGATSVVLVAGELQRWIKNRQRR